TVSKLLPAVEATATPVWGAVHDHHTELPPPAKAGSGSPGSNVALRFEPVRSAGRLVITARLANESLAGGTVTVNTTAVLADCFPAALAVRFTVNERTPPGTVNCAEYSLSLATGSGPVPLLTKVRLPPVDNVPETVALLITTRSVTRTCIVTEAPGSTCNPPGTFTLISSVSSVSAVKELR